MHYTGAQPLTWTHTPNPSHALTLLSISFTHTLTPTLLNFPHTNACHYITPPPLLHSIHTGASPSNNERQVWSHVSETVELI